MVEDGMGEDNKHSGWRTAVPHYMKIAETKLSFIMLF